MPRDANGNYTLPAGNPVVSGTTILSVWANDTMPDLGAAMTDSLSRSGQGGMLVPLLLADGSTIAPAISFVTEPTMGFYRPEAGVLAIAIASAERARFKANGNLAVAGAAPVIDEDLTRKDYVDAGDAAASGVFDQKLAGYLDTGLSLEYTGDLDDILVNSTYAINSNNVTNAPADLTSGLRVLTTFALSGNSLVQIIYGRGAPNVYKQWMREASSAVWGPWEKVVDGAPFVTDMVGTPPSNPSVGDVWWDINTGRPYVYYDDGDSTQWVEENAPIVAQPHVTGVIAFARTASDSTFDYQSGFASVVEDVAGEYEYTFSSPLPNDQYIVQCNSSNADHNCGVQASSMTVNGFLLRNFNAGGSASASTHMVSVFQ